MTFAPYPVTTRISSWRARLGFWLWAGAVALFVVGVILGIALHDVLPNKMGISDALVFPFAATFLAIPVSTVGFGFSIASLVKREPRRHLAVFTVVAWPLTPFVGFIVLRVVLALIDS